MRYFEFGLELNQNLLLVNIIIITYFIPLEVFHTEDCRWESIHT